MKIGIKNETVKKSAIINLIIISGLLLAIIVVKIKIMARIPTMSVLGGMVAISDFTDVLKFSAGKLGENATGNYFPFTYVVMNILEFISFGYYKVLYIIVVISCSLVYIWFCKSFLKSYMNKKEMYIHILLLLFMQFPMLFALQRGNIEIIILALCMLFYVFYKKEKYYLAAVLLSFAVCMKLYPALLAMLFISKKQYKAFFTCVGASLGITILSFLLVQENLGGLTHYLGSFTNFLDYYGKLSGMQYNHSILFGIYYFAYKFLNISLYTIFTSNLMSVYTIGIVIIAIPLILYTTFKKMAEWKKVTLLVLMMISFPQISFEYTLILTIIPIILFIADQETKRWENIVYSVLFRFIANTYEY